MKGKQQEKCTERQNKKEINKRNRKRRKKDKDESEKNTKIEKKQY